MPVNIAMQNYISQEQDRFYVAQAEQKRRAAATITTIKCQECLRPLELDDFSGKYKKQLPALIREHGVEELAQNGYVTCKMCTGQHKVEQKCYMCDITKSLDEFTRSQRRFKELAVCMGCAKEKEDSQPLGFIAEEAKKEEWVDELVANTSGLTIAASTPSIPKRSKFFDKKSPKASSQFTTPVKSYSTSASSTVISDYWSGQSGTASSTNQTWTVPSPPSSPTLQSWAESSASSSPTLQTSTESSASSSPAVSTSNSSVSANEFIEAATKRTNERRRQNKSYDGGRRHGQKGKSSTPAW